MVFYPATNNQSNPGGSNPSLPTFDLQSEKLRIKEGRDEIRQELLAAWQKKYSKAQIFPSKLSAVNPELIDFLLSFKNTAFYDELARKFGFSEEQRDLFPQIVWSICLAKNWYGLENLLQSEIKINPSTAGQISILTNQNILFRAKELGEKVFMSKRFTEEKIESGFENVPIQEALKKHPELGEQLITSERITLKSFPGPVRPSIKNWLADYNFVAGYDQKRSGIERTNYLFHNVNTQKLNSAERERLSLILKSYDENYPVPVNKNTKQVVFPQVVQKPAQQPMPQPAKTMAPPTSPRPTSPLAAASFINYKSVPASADIKTPAPQPTPKPTQSAVPHPSIHISPAQPVVQPTVHYAPRSANNSPPGQSTNQLAQSFHRNLPPAKPSAPLPHGKLEIKVPTQSPKNDDKNIRFTSPHTLPFEKEETGNLQPYRITPLSTDADENNLEEETTPTKNIVNLKE